MAYKRHNSSPAGPCPNCGKETRTSGNVTEETRNMARMNKSAGKCEPCTKGVNVKRVPFAWERRELDRAVLEGMGMLYGI